MNLPIFRLKYKIIRLLDTYLSGDSMNYRQVITIILPLLVDQAFIVILSLLNTAMIASSGEAAISAVNMIDTINIFLLNIFIAIATGGTVMVAQFKGVCNHKQASKAAGQAVLAVGIVSFLCSILLVVFHMQLLTLLFGTAEQAVLDNARIYLIGSCITYPFIAILEAICGASRGAGDSKPSLWLTLITNGTYVLLNIVFITILHMGVYGMVISLFVARLFGVICSLVYFLVFQKTIIITLKDLFHVDFAIMRKILFVGIPFAAEQMFFNGGKILTQTFIVQLGTHALVINAICNSLSMLLQIGAAGNNLAIITVVGQCVGRGDIKDARKFIRSFLILGFLFFIVSDIIVLSFLPILVGFFSPPADIVPTVYKIMWISALVSPFLWTTSFTTPSALRAAGDSRFTSVSSMLSMWLFRVVLGYILGVVLPFGIVGVWIAMMCEWGIRGGIFLWRFHGNKWFQHRLVD